MVEVSNTREMRVLLNSLFNSSKYRINENSIVIDVDKNELVYAINSCDDAVQEVFGCTNEWQEIINLIM